MLSLSNGLGSNIQKTLFEDYLQFKTVKALFQILTWGLLQITLKTALQAQVPMCGWLIAIP